MPVTWVILTVSQQEMRAFFMATTEPIRDKRQIKEMASFYLKQGKLRNYLLIVMGVHTGLRVSDLLRLRRGDVYDFDSGCFRSHLTLTERKTGKTKTLALNKKVLAALALCFGGEIGCSEDFLFPNNRKKSASIGRVQAWRIVKKAAQAIGVAGCIGCHSLRKTLGYHAWKAGVAAVLLMDIFNHSNFETTKRYLGVSQDERDKVYLSLALI